MVDYSYDLLEGTVTLYTERLFRSRGEVGEWATNVTAYYEVAATNAAPFRTGEMANSIRAEVENQPADHVVDMFVSVGVDYAIHVLGGTDGVAVMGHYHPVGLESAYGPSFPGGGYDKVTKVFAAPKGAGYVKGQEANNFLRGGYEITARRFRALGGYEDYLGG